MFKLTVEEALAIQSTLCAWYEQFCPGITAMVAERTDATRFTPGVEYDVSEIDRYIPRGGAIERIAGLADTGGN